jgi:hypothetical protein
LKISIANGGLIGRDYNSVNDPVVFNAAYPMQSTAALIQRKAVQLNVSRVDTMPANVSTDQSNVAAMNLILTDAGDTRTASVMLTRLYMYLKDGSDAYLMNPSDVIKGIRITSPDGTAIYGETLSFTGYKITVNLTSPIVVSAAGSITATVRVDIASSAISNNFKVSIDSNADLYAVDANSFVPVGVDVASGFIFPVQSGVTNIENKATGVNIDTFSQLAPAGVTKGLKRVPLFTFRIQNPAAAGTANAVFYSLTLSVKDASNNDLSANSAVEKFYLIDGAANTLAMLSTGVSNLAPLTLTVPRALAGNAYVYVTVYADIPSTATAAGFKVLLQSNSMISIRDENSGLEISKTPAPVLPWDSGALGIYDAPATDLHAWRTGAPASTVSKGQLAADIMGLWMYNPGTAGTSDVILSGVTLTVYDDAGNSLAPNSTLSFIEITDIYGAYYGGLTLTAYSSAAPFYVEALRQIAVPASNTTTVYFKADIAAAAASGIFRVSVDNAAYVNVHNKPAGYVTVTAETNNAFPLDKGLITIITSANIVKAGHENLMPVSAVLGQAGVGALRINLRNESILDMNVKGITITVKDKTGAALNAGDVLSGIRIIDGTGNTVYATGTAGASGRVFFDLTASVPLFSIPKVTDNSFRVVIDVLATATKPFYLELESDTDIATNPPASILAMSGDSFGEMKSSTLSLQKAKLEDAYHNFPNPFNPDDPAGGSTHIEYYLANQAEVTIKILTLEGRPVRDLLNKAIKPAGLHYEDEWDGSNGAGGKVRSGVYLCVLEVKDAGGTKKLIKKVGVLR